MTQTTTVLVTGARGFMGSALLDLIRREPVPDLNLVGVDHSDADLRDPDAVARLLSEVRPQRVLHLAGKLIKGEGPEVLREQMQHTFHAGTVVLSAALDLGVEQVLIPGTMDEFGSREGELRPGDASEPVSYYGLSKCLLREYAVFFARRRPVRLDWFRPFIAYGPGQTRGGMLLPTAFRAAKSGQRAQFSDGVQQRDFIHVDDVALWLLAAFRVPLPAAHPGLHVHHLGTGDAVAVRDVLAIVAGEFPAAQFEIGALPRRPGEPQIQVSPPYESADPVLNGWRPRYRWRDGIRQTAAWWKSKDDAL